MFLNDLDPHFINSLNYLYNSDQLAKGDAIPLQFYLEEAIKNKYGITKDLSATVATSMKQRRVTEFKPFVSLDESNGSGSDKELELDLWKEDLMCIICNGMDVGARNRLLECSDCHMLYHQECHKPIVTNQDSFDDWICQNCKDAAKKLKTSAASTSNSSSHVKLSSSSSTPTAPSSSSSSSKSSSSSHRHGSSSSSYKSTSSSDSKSSKYSKSSSSSSKISSSSSTSKATTSSSSTSRSNVTPNINIISADKRIQIMKKKAAKQHEKRLTPRLPR